MKKIFYIDLFSGAGGTTTGLHLTDEEIEVVACVNHDEKAIESHKANHPNCLHFVEDVTDMKVIKALNNLVIKLRKRHPDCIIILWASIECTDYSKAKGGQPRDADSRTLAHTLYDYIDIISPDYLMIENVREFMSWGSLDENGRPVSMNKGIDYIKWVDKIQSYGYSFGWKLLNSADFGAYTSRERFFCQFAKDNLPIVWPESTHSKKPEKANLFDNSFKPWKAVKDVLDLEDEGNSIFNRKKNLVEPTLKRIYAGLIKFVAGGEDAFTKVYNSGNDNNRVRSLNDTIGSLTTQNSHAVVKCNFIQKHFSGAPKHKVVSVDNPTGALTTTCNQSLVSVRMFTSYYGNSTDAQSVDKPCPTVTTKDRFSAIFIDQQYGNGKPFDINDPLNTITAIPKFSLVNVKHRYLMNPQFNSKGSSIEKPCFTLIAKMDKRPPYIINVDEDKKEVIIYENDSPMTVKIKEFMILYWISDIKMRMLKVIELLKIQGFPDGYILKGNQADQKKSIGNAVVPIVAKAIAESNARALINYFKRAL